MYEVVIEISDDDIIYVLAKNSDDAEDVADTEYDVDIEEPTLSFHAYPVDNKKKIHKDWLKSFPYFRDAGEDFDGTCEEFMEELENRMIVEKGLEDQLLLDLGI